jgi:hypothetical protein
MFRTLFIASLLAIVSSAQAATLVGHVTGYANVSNGSTPTLLVKIDTADKVGCNTTGRFAISSADVRYKATLPSVIAAHATQTQVKISYDETCDLWTNAYNLNFVCVGDAAC